MLESAVLLFLVIDPFGNLPVVLALLRELPAARYRVVVLRETALAFVVLAVFAAAGEQVLGYLQVEKASLAVAGGVILFLISLKMIFRSSAAIFEARERDDPLFIPIAVPLLAGPSAITTVMIVRGQQDAGLATLLAALAIVIGVAAAIFLLGRRLSALVGTGVVGAMEKLMGLLLNLVAVDMILRGVREFLRA